MPDAFLRGGRRLRPARPPAPTPPASPSCPATPTRGRRGRRGASRRSSPSEGLRVLGWRDVPDRRLDARRDGRRRRCRRSASCSSPAPAGAERASTSSAGCSSSRKRIEHEIGTRRRRRLLPEPVVPHARLQGHAHHAAARRVLPRPRDERVESAPGPRALPVLHQHVPVVAARPPVPLHRPQRRDQHRAGQPQLDAGPRGAAGERPAPRRPRAHLPDLHARRAATRPASTRCSSCCTWAAARCPTPC